MDDLTLTEQTHVRTALRYLRRRIGTWAAVAEALRISPKTLEPIVAGRRPVTASLAIRVARTLDASVDEVLAGTFLAGACPRCGYVPDFAGESTKVEAEPRPATGLKLVP